jgi:3-oxoadipate enol-lactonase
MTRLHHRFDGPPDAPVVVLGHSLGATMDLWAPQMPELGSSWRLLRYDLPGHGGSEVMHGTVEDFADAVVEMLDELGLDKVIYGGVSLGGAIGTTLAIRHPDRIRSLMLCCSSAQFGPPSGWRDRAETVREVGLMSIQDMLFGRWFTPNYGDTSHAEAMLERVNPEGYAACCEALAVFDARDRLGDVHVPTLIIAGADDIATPVDHAEELARGIRGAEFVLVPEAGHLANLERPVPVTHAMLRHLERIL